MTPREARPFVVLGFATTHDALDAEALLGDLGIDVVPIPAPQSIGALCGIALRLEPRDSERALEYLDRGGIAVTAMGQIEDF